MKSDEQGVIIDDSMTGDLATYNKAFMDKITDDLNKQIQENEKWLFTIEDVYEAFEIPIVYRSALEQAMYRTHGWSWKNPELHYLTFDELHPYKCPCCGRPL